MTYLSSLETDLAHFETAEDALERRALALESIREDLVKAALAGRDTRWLEYDGQIDPQDKQFQYRANHVMALYGEAAPAVVMRHLDAWRRACIIDWAKHEAPYELEREVIRDEEDMHAQDYGLPREAA